jgi:excisionase family DNA binding protein
MNNPFESIEARLNTIESLLLNLKDTPKEPLPIRQEPQQFCTRKETARRLNITLATLNEYTKTGKIIANRIGNRVLYKESDIQNALRQVKTSTKA